MVERTFFDLRYALPGYTFILIVLLVSFPTVKTIFGDPISLGTAIPALVALLGGGAFGFLVSQLWYAFYEIYLKGNKPELISRMINEELPREYRLRGDRRNRYFFLNYLHLKSKNRQMIAYTQRRWDLMHICGSTLTALWTGVVGGIIVRLLGASWNSSIKDIFVLIITRSFWTGLTKFRFSVLGLNYALNLTLYDLVVVIVIFALTVLLFWNLHTAMREHSLGAFVTVHEGMRYHRRNIFPEEWFDEEEQN